MSDNIRVNWFDYLTAKIVGEEAKVSDEEARLSAGDWTVCACGSQEKILRKTGAAEPWDAELDDLGTTFFTKVDHAQWEQALGILLKIQHRAGYLLSKIRRAKPEVVRALRRHDADIWNDVTPTAEKDAALVSKFYKRVGGSHANG